MTMRVSIAELCDKLGVGYVLGAYQTHPVSFYNATTGATCSAEVRMGTSDDELEAEAQMMYDTPPAGKAPMEQICHIRATAARDGMWSVVSLRIRNEPFGSGIHDWDVKSCVFFSMLLAALGAEEIPDMDELIDEAFHGRERFNSQRQGGGGKAPKAKANQILGAKRGGF